MPQLFNHWNLFPAFRFSSFLHWELLNSMLGLWTQNREQRWAGLGGQWDAGSRCLRYKQFGGTAFINLGSKFCCQLGSYNGEFARCPPGWGWGGQAQVACPLPVHSGKAAGGPAGGFLVTVVILFFNILLSKVLKVQEARWRPDNIVPLVPS